ncbi:MAG: phosphonate lyase system protein PhnH [Paenibacillus sp.]|jgi:alpha-D-ribose 1-methylphosphonate 5-triphosphate synthase subunit PhnH|nr:phosphonate lyase system protein PhnH [Paenibacillus sp.]
MKLDQVHDIQTAYRKVIDSMSRPGTVSVLSEEAGKLERDESFLPSTLVLAKMVLDTEVTFKVFSGREAEAAHTLGQLTYAREAEASEADYIFVLLDAAPGDLLRAIEAAKIGELGDPHFSATLIIETAGLSGGEKLQLTGPGIRDFAHAEPHTGDDWIESRAGRNAEFPLGLDLIFVDADHRLLALPRTTQIAREGS